MVDKANINTRLRIWVLFDGNEALIIVQVNGWSRRV